MESGINGEGIGMMLGMLLTLPVMILIFAGFWKMFEKARYDGWKCLVPFYNFYIMTKIADKPSWWIILMCIPYANIVAMIVIGLGMAKNFGKSELFGIGIGILSPIFIPILGYGDAEYKGGDEWDIEDNLIEE